ncbi:MAG TPA: GTP 3',8-cyclase MoaA [Xanthomonadaceae bacterium]|nr:GTP 3',8-cyclase MoaA [Xanthomonadaceae bacterium]
MKPTPSLPLEIQSRPRDRLGRGLKDLRISVVDTCNFRCPYCMPEERYPRDHAFLSSRERLDFDEIERLARQFVMLGVRKLRLTGGEPLLRRDLPDLVRSLATIPGLHDLALTTNASLLAAQAPALRAAGLHRITVSLDSLDPDRFAALSGGRGQLAEALRGIAAAERAGFTPMKINVVVQRGINDQDVMGLVEYFRGSGHILRFIEFMDVGTCNGWRLDRVVPSALLRRRIHSRWPLIALGRHERSEVASRYAFADGAGEIGFVSSVSEPFCGDCARARLSADGQLFTCLFASRGHDLRGPLRAGISDYELRTLIARLWNARGDRYSELRQAATGQAPGRVEMYRIGG